MSVAEHPARTWTAEALMALPDDGIERDLIRGVLRERPRTWQSPQHSGVEASVVFILSRWLDRRPEPRGRLHSGDVGFRLQREPETFLGIDVAYVSAAMIASMDPELPFYDGPPVLAVEILSPSDTHERIVEKVQLYLEVGTVVWIADPDFRTITVHRPGLEPEMFNVRQEISGEPYLPGFRVPVAQFFE